MRKGLPNSANAQMGVWRINYCQIEWVVINIR
jgi:hypothetical protein